MRTLLFLGLGVVGAFMAGWFTIEREGDRTRIEINKTEIRADTRQAIDKGKDFLDQREQDRLAQQQQPIGYGQGQAQGQTPWGNPNGAVQGAGYAQPAPYNAPQQPYQGQQQYSQPGYNANYPAPGNQQQGNQQSPPRWTEMPPPWQQQTR